MMGHPLRAKMLTLEGIFMGGTRHGGRHCQEGELAITPAQTVIWESVQMNDQDEDSA